jgi:hypothetical protein
LKRSVCVVRRILTSKIPSALLVAFVRVDGVIHSTDPIFASRYEL